MPGRRVCIGTVTYRKMGIYTYLRGDISMVFIKGVLFVKQRVKSTERFFIQQEAFF